MIKFLAAMMKGVLALFVTLLVVMCMGIIAFLYMFSGWLALGFLVFLVVYVLIDEGIKRINKRRQARPDT